MEMHGSSSVLWSSEREWRGNEIKRGEREKYSAVPCSEVKAKISSQMHGKASEMQVKEMC